MDNNSDRIVIFELVKVAKDLAYAKSPEEAQLHTYELRNILKKFEDCN
jgi:hypothetical protein